MTITNTQWNSTTDPFVLATAISLDAFNWTSTTGDQEITYTAAPSGLLNFPPDGDEFGRVRFENQADPNRGFAPTAVYSEGNAVSANGSIIVSPEEFAQFEDDRSGDYEVFYVIEQIGDCGGTNDFSVWVSNKTQGTGDEHRLHIEYAYAWHGKDPAQIIFSMIKHYVFGGTAVEEWMYKDDFQTASAYYVNHPCALSWVRKTGETIADSVRDIMGHTSDMLSVRMNALNGQVELAFLVRRLLDDRDTVIDLSSRSVVDFTYRPTDQYTLDAVNVNYGQFCAFSLPAGGPQKDRTNWIYDVTSDGADGIPQKWDKYQRQEYGAEGNPRVAELTRKSFNRRSDIAWNLPLQYWNRDQDELEVEFSDLTHFNFEPGDVVHVTGRAGIDPSWSYLCFEKTLDIDNLTATARFLRVHGLQGKLPCQINYGLMQQALRPEAVGYLHRGTVITLPGRIDSELQRPFDRWYDQGKFYNNGWQMDRGNGGPSGANPTPPQYSANVINGWGAFDFDGQSSLNVNSNAARGHQSHRAIFGGASIAIDQTFFFVLRIDTLTSANQYLFHDAGASPNQLVIAAVGPSGTGPRYYDGAWHGTAAGVTGWQILTFRLDDAGASIRRNGTNINTGLSYTQTSINGGAIGSGDAGNGAFFNGAIAEVIAWGYALSTSDMEAVEQHLGDKYGITV